MATKISTVTFTDAEVDWLKSKAISDAAITAYRGEVARLSTFCASIGIVEVSHFEPEHWTAYVTCLSADRSAISSQWKPLKPSSALQAFRITRAFLLHCTRSGWLNWDPRDVDASIPTAMRSGELPTIGKSLSPSLREVLSNAPLAADEQQARRYFALGLGFWGAMSPREMSLLKVRDLRISRVSGEGTLTCGNRPYPVVLPVELVALWRRYQQCRQEATSRSIKPSSALISNLRSGDSLCTWSIWALMQSGRDNEKEAKEAINPRILRSAYVEGTTRNAARDIGIVRNQVGRRVDISVELSGLARQRALGSLHEVTLAKLREPLRITK